MTDVADGAVLVAALEPDPAERRVAGRDPDAQAELVAALAPVRAEGLRNACQASAVRTAASSWSSITAGSLKNAISPSPAKCSIVPPFATTSSPAAVWYSPQDAEHLFWFGCLGECREAAQVEEERGDLAPVTCEELLALVAREQVGGLRRETGELGLAAARRSGTRRTFSIAITTKSAKVSINRSRRRRRAAPRYGRRRSHRSAPRRASSERQAPSGSRRASASQRRAYAGILEHVQDVDDLLAGAASGRRSTPVPGL